MVPVWNCVEDFYVRFEDCVGFSIHDTFLHNLQNGHKNLQHNFTLVQLIHPRAVVHVACVQSVGFLFFSNSRFFKITFVHSNANSIQISTLLGIQLNNYFNLGTGNVEKLNIKRVFYLLQIMLFPAFPVPKLTKLQ